MNTDTEKLRRDLTDYYGTAAFGGNPAAFVNVSDIQRADERELEKLAKDAGLDLRKYQK